MLVLDETKVIELARKALEIDDLPEETLPPRFLAAFKLHVAARPNDTNFIVEISKPGKKNAGGNGFGIATCLEEQCWSDIRLSADPTVRDGGRADGFGTLWEYQMHCDSEDHLAGRQLRIAQTKKSYAPYRTARVAPQPAVGGPPPSGTSTGHAHAASRHAFPIGTSAVHSSGANVPRNVERTSSGASSGSALLPSSSHNINPAGRSSQSSAHPLDIKPNLAQLSSARVPYTDEVLTLPEAPAHMRKVTNAASPISVDSGSDDDVLPIGEAGPSRSQIAGPSRAPAVDSKRALFRAGSGMSADDDSKPNAFNMMMAERYPQKRKTAKRETSPAAASRPAEPAPPPMRSTDLVILRDADLLAKTFNERRRLMMAEISHSNRYIMQSKSLKPSDLAVIRDRQLLLTRSLPLHDTPYPSPDDLLRRTAPTLYAYATEQAQLALRLMRHALQSRLNPPVAAQPAGPSNAVAGPSRVEIDQKPFAPGFVAGYGTAYGAGYGTDYGLGYGGGAGVGALVPQSMAHAAPPVEHGVNCTCGAFCDFDNDDDFPMGPGGYPMPWMARDHVDDMNQYLNESFKDFSEDKTIDDALGSLGLADLQQKFSDMTVSLMPHQVLGVAFMLEKEKNKLYRGGLLCDAMGLGKTVQTIATIAGNVSEDRKCKTTLIVAPLAVLEQWKTEIETKTAAGLFKVIIHHGGQRSKSKSTLLNADVVLTTYGTLTSESGQDTRNERKVKKRRARASDSEDDEEEIIVKPKGPMFKMKWYRVVLDEAHTIRNRATLASKATHMLNAVHRWSLTGTLVNNSLNDIYPHLRFLGITPQREWDHFNKTIAKVSKKQPRLATKRVQAILKPFMMRRHKESTLNGKRLLELPPKITTIVELEFSPEEREIYNSIEQRMRIRFGQFLKQGTVLKHLSCVLTMLVRLRQLTCHPWLLRRNPGDPAHPHDFYISDEDLFTATNFDAHQAHAAEDLERALADPAMGLTWVETVGKNLKERHARLLNAAKVTEDDERDGECSICLDLFTDEVITKCKHSYCRGCVGEIFENPPRDGLNDLTDVETARGARKCPLCRAVIEPNTVFAATAFFDPEKEVDVKPDVNEKDRKGKRKSTGTEEEEGDVKPTMKMLKLDGKGKGRAKEDPEDEVITRPEQVLPSTKMQRLFDLVKEYLAEPGIKVIVFSEFVTFLALCEAFLDQERIKHVAYNGKMRHPDREDAVKRFNTSDDDGARVMLISRKAGGAGLNLTAASKVVSLDLAWNAAAENQAVDRAHRIGQMRDVDVQRLVVKDTVEQRILELQEKKQALADGAMGEGQGGRLGRLTVGDLMRLFAYGGEREEQG